MPGTLRPITHGSTADTDRLSLNAERGRTEGDIHTFGDAIWWPTTITHRRLSIDTAIGPDRLPGWIGPWRSGLVLR
jgi:hypothetical protein